jgi:hypothetical protein
MSLTVMPQDGTALTAGVTYVGSYRNYDFLAVNRCLGGTGPCPESFLNSGTTRAFIIDYPDFAKLNAALSQRITQQLETFVSIDNLTNTQADEGSTLEPRQGRLTMVGLHVTY